MSGDQVKEKTKTSKAKSSVEEEMSIAEFIRIFIFAAIFTFFLRLLVFDPFSIPSESMVPNLVTGDYLVVSKPAYGYSKHSVPLFSPNLFSGRIFEKPVKRGDIAVFKLPRDNETDYIKRIVGLPGDTVQMKNGQLFVNGVGYKRERVADFVFVESENMNCNRFPHFRVQGAEGSECHYPQYRETMPNGLSYLTLDLIPNNHADNTNIYTVPNGHYFAVGDNRDNSIDGRWPKSSGVGFVPIENFVGRAVVVLWSNDGSGSIFKPWTWFSMFRGERAFYSLSPDKPDNGD